MVQLAANTSQHDEQEDEILDTVPEGVDLEEGEHLQVSDIVVRGGEMRPARLSSSAHAYYKRFGDGYGVSLFCLRGVDARAICEQLGASAPPNAMATWAYAGDVARVSGGVLTRTFRKRGHVTLLLTAIPDESVWERVAEEFSVPFRNPAAR